MHSLINCKAVIKKKPCSVANQMAHWSCYLCFFIQYPQHLSRRKRTRYIVLPGCTLGSTRLTRAKTRTGKPRFAESPWASLLILTRVAMVLACLQHSMEGEEKAGIILWNKVTTHSPYAPNAFSPNYHITRPFPTFCPSPTPVISQQHNWFSYERLTPPGRSRESMIGTTVKQVEEMLRKRARI